VSDDPEEEALVADRYLDALLAALERHARDVPADASLDPDFREAARVLRASLVRVHPSFRFEERLAGTLAELAAAQATPALAAAGGALVDFPGGAGAPLHGDRLRADPLLSVILRGDLDPADGAAVEHASRGPVPRRPLLVGGALTSAAISLVGVAYVAWRASRPQAGEGRSRRALARTAGHARARRAADVAAGIVGLGGPA